MRCFNNDSAARIFARRRENLPSNVLRSNLRPRRLVAWAAGLFFLAFAATVEAAPVMAIQGHGAVGGAGQFTYSIPIVVPPGTAGMVPSLSLDYSNQNGDGFVGLGWSLGGLPAITRCARTLAIDGVRGAVNYDMNDRFCLNGQRLMAASNYGQDGSTYETYIADFSKIVAHGSAGNGPAWFEVHLRSGTVLEFGNTTDSQIKAVGSSTVREWLVDKITDTKGNYLTVSYTNDQTNGQAYPSRIDYTGNAGAGLATYNSVQFTYAARGDIVPGYRAGSLEQPTVLLTDIKTYAGATLVTDYQLGYRAGTSVLNSRLTSVSQCDGSGQCLAPTTIGWQGGNGLPTMTGTAMTLAQGDTLLAGDFDNDGVTDALTYGPSDCGTIHPGSGTGTFGSTTYFASYVYWTVPARQRTTKTGDTCLRWFATSGLNSASVGDFDGDGRADILKYDQYYASGSPPAVSYSSWLQNTLSGGNLHFSELVEPSSTGSGASPPFVVLGDFNGDGKEDGYWDGPPSFPNGYYLSNGNGTFAQSSGPTAGSGNVLSGDFDGDGCTDLLDTWSHKIFYSCNPAVTFTSVTSTSVYSNTFIGDFNGDGLSDILVVTSTAATLYLSTGTGLATGIAISGSSTWHSYKVVTGDWNGDGQTDIALLSKTSGTPHLIFLSTGTDFSQVATIANTDTNVAGVVADWNSDGADDLWLKKSSGDLLYTFAYAPEVVTSVSNGLGASTTVAYNRLNKNGTFYAQGTGNNGPLYVVSNLSQSNGIGGTINTAYTYAGVNLDRRNPPQPRTRFALAPSQFRAFTSVIATDSQTGLVTTTNYLAALPYAGLVSGQTTVSGGTTLKSMSNQYNSSTTANGANVVTLKETDVAQTDLSGAALPSLEIDYTYDAYANPTVVRRKVIPSTGANFTTTITNTYTNDTTNWILGQIATSNVQGYNGGSTLTRHFTYGHDAASGLLTQKIAEPGTPSVTLENDFGYDAFGNRSSVATSGAGLASRTATAGYDARGEFQTSQTNPLSQGTSAAFDPNFGGVTSQTDLNGLTTTVSYDTFGRAVLSVRPDGNKTVQAYAYCSGVNGGSAACPTYGAYVVTSTPENSSGSQNGAITTTYYDALDRVIASDVQGFDGSEIRTATQYDSDGRVGQTSRPYFVSGGTPKWTVYTYDVLSRATQTTFPDGSHTTRSYQGLTSSVTNAKSQTTTTVLNLQGLVDSVASPAGQISYEYDAFGNLTQVTDPRNNVSTNTFDIRGRMTASTDPDRGSWTFGYDGLSEMTSSVDAKSQSASYAYDQLGRQTQRVEADLTSNWIYDTATDGVGALASGCTGTGCSAPGSSSYFRALSYDSQARASATALTINGTTYSYGTTYNSDGRIDTVTYPSGFVAKYVYNAYGYLAQIKDNGSGAAIWTANGRNAELNLTQVTAGNGVVTGNVFDPNTGRIVQTQVGTSGSPTSITTYSYGWDTIGNLTSRSDTYEGFTENFCYDTSNRLTNYAFGVSCTASGTKTVAYDALGNVTSKSGVGTYSYPTAPGSALPHAVASITGTVNGVTNPTFNYDANGNMTAGDGRTITPTSFNMTAAIVQGTTSECLSYDSEHNRIAQVQTSATCASPGSSASTTVYLNDPSSGTMSENFTAGTTVTWRDYVTVDGEGIVAERFNTGGIVSLSYFTGDNLGSTSIVTDGTGAVQERDSYDSWGLRRNADGSDASTCNAISSVTTRGYTGQEHVDPVCLINYNARFYDPILGRFQAADSVIPNSLDLQSYNRFSYVNNEPLSATDPTGHTIYSGAPVIIDVDIDFGALGLLNTNYLSDYETVTVTADRIPVGPLGPVALVPMSAASIPTPSWFIPMPAAGTGGGTRVAAANDNLPKDWSKFFRNDACTIAGHDCLAEAPGKSGLCMVEELTCNRVAAAAKEQEEGILYRVHFSNGQVVVIPSGGMPPFLGPKTPVKPTPRY